MGVWELTPDNKFLPWNKTLTIQANADYMLVAKNNNSTSRGKMDVKGGQMMMLNETGEIGTMYYEFVDRNVLHITDLDGTKYEARRRP